MLDWFDTLNTTVLPVEFKNGKFVLKDGKELLSIQEGARAENVIPTFYIDDKKIKEEYNKEQIFSFFPSKTVLYVELYVRNFDNLTDEEKEQLQLFQNRYLVEIELIDELNIKDRGTKYPRLEACKCKVVKLKDFEAKSLNEIYSKLPQRYESHRMSHTGNVFDKIYYFQDETYTQLKYRKYG